MAITFVGSATATAINGATATITLPAGMLQNDIVVVLQGCGGTPTSNPGATNGYTLIANTSPSARAAKWCGYKIMGASPDTTVTLTSTGSATEAVAGLVLVFRGVDTTTPLDVTATEASGNSANPDCPAITPTSDNCAILAFANSEINDTTPGTSAGYSTPVVSSSAAETRPQGAAGCYLIKTGGAGVSENPGAYSSWTTGQWNATTIALRPVSAGPVLGTGATAGSATVVGVGQARFQAVGSSSGASTALGAGRARIRVVGASAGAAVASGVGRARTRSVGTSAGSAVAAAIVSAVRFRAVGISSGVAAVLGIGQVHVRATGLASGSSFVMGRPKGSASGSSDGAATVLGVGRARTRVVGAASGTGTALGVGRARIRSIGAASGAGTAAGFKPAASPPSFSIGFIIG